jgi:hypothetical protein
MIELVNLEEYDGEELEMTTRPESPYKPVKPVLPKLPLIRSNKSSPYDASGRPKSE